MRIGIVEDEQKCVELVKSYLERYTSETGQQFVVSCFSDGDEIIDDYTCSYDILFLDIEMKRVNGMEAARYIRERDKDVIIIFVTNMAQYAIHGYDVGALGYLLKPLSYFAFQQELMRSIKLINSRESNHIIIPLGSDGIVCVSLVDIKFVESVKHRLIVHTVNGDYDFFGTIKDFEKQVDRNFFRCNSGYLVNLKWVNGIKNNIAYVGNSQLVISRPRRKAFLAALTAYCGGLTHD